MNPAPLTAANQNSTPTKLLIVCLLALLPFSRSYGQVTFTGLLQQGTSSTGQTAGSPIWNTLGNETAFANLYITQPNAGYSAPFLNHGNGASASISYALTAGTYQFYFFCDAFPNNNPGNYGLNLFFNGDNTNPGIAAYSPSGVDNATPVGLGLPTLSLNGSDTTVSAPGALTYSANGLSVTLTDYGFGQSGVFSPTLDRVGNLNDAPDGSLDGVGFFDLTVAVVPEPSALAIGCLAVLVLLARKLNCISHIVRIASWRGPNTLKAVAVGMFIFSGRSLDLSAQTVQYFTLSTTNAHGINFQV